MHNTIHTSPLLIEIKSHGLPLDELTVLARARDPFRLDTPANHRDGAWLGACFARLVVTAVIHLRGLHYVLVSAQVVKPDGLPYHNDEADWLWLQDKASKAGRWLNYVGWDRISDERNDTPAVILWQPQPPTATVVPAIDFEIPAAYEIEPRIGVRHCVGAQPYKLVVIGEKSSLREVLAPIAQRFGADLYLPAGEASDTMLYNMARVGVEDGRPMVVFYFTDCDPYGYAMPGSVGRKLQAFQTSQFPALDFEVHHVGLTPEQVKRYGLPSTPMKENPRTAAKRRAWREAMGVEQTEIDALAALQPDLLARMAREAIAPFFDATLDGRVRAARTEWLAAAQGVLVDRLGPDRLADIRATAAARLAEMQEQLDELAEQLAVDIDDLDLPDFGIPESDVDRDGLPSPLIDSTWGFVEGTRRLRATRFYAEDGDE
jgi:hypothetical protein